MEEVWTRLVQDMIDRVSGPMNFRLVMQPLMATIFVLALILDAVYQFMVSRFVYPGEAIIVAILLAVVPYPAVRGLVARLARKR